MTSRWIAAFLILGALAARPVLAQSPAQPPAPKDVAPAASGQASPAPAGAAPANGQAPGNSKAPGDPNVSYPLANGGTYQGPLTGQPSPTAKFYKGYNRT